MQDRGPLREIGNFSLYVDPERWDECLRFYRDTLGIALEARADAFGYAVFRFQRGPTLVVERDQPDDGEASAAGRFTGVSFTVTDVDRTYADLVARGVRFVGLPETQAWGGRLAYCLDPSGNTLTLAQYAKQ